MLIKIQESPERYVNTDNIEVVSFGRLTRQQQPTQQQQRGCVLDFRSGRQLTVSEQAGRILVEFSEANSAFAEFEPGELPEPGQGGQAVQHGAIPKVPPLQSRIAQYLRDSAPNGATIMDLVMVAHNDEPQLMETLDALAAERVAVFIPGDGAATMDRYYHASNVPLELRPQASLADFNEPAAGGTGTF